MIANYILASCVVVISIIGSIVGVCVKNISHKLNDIFVGFASGVMLAASFLELLPSAFDGFNDWLILIPIAGVAVGGLVISLIDKFMPHAHFTNGELVYSESGSRQSNRIMLIVIAIAIHNVPEGLATGLAATQGKDGLTMLISILLQKLPEGLIVAIPLISMGMSKRKVMLYSVLVAMMMVPGILVGIFFGNLPSLAVSFFIAFAFGAIIYVISDEMIPESHQHGFQRAATFALLTGALCVGILKTLIA